MRITDQRKNAMIKCIRNICSRILSRILKPIRWWANSGLQGGYKNMYCDIQNHFLPLSSAIRSSNDSVP